MTKPSPAQEAEIGPISLKRRARYWVRDLILVHQMSTSKDLLFPR